MCQEWDLCLYSYFRISLEVPLSPRPPHTRSHLSKCHCLISRWSSARYSLYMFLLQRTTRQSFHMLLFAAKRFFKAMLSHAFQSSSRAQNSLYISILHEVEPCSLCSRDGHDAHRSKGISLCPHDVITRGAAFSMKHWFHLLPRSLLSRLITFCIL